MNSVFKDNDSSFIFMVIKEVNLHCTLDRALEIRPQLHDSCRFLIEITGTNVDNTILFVGKPSSSDPIYRFILKNVRILYKNYPVEDLEVLRMEYPLSSRKLEIRITNTTRRSFLKMLTEIIQ